MIYFLLFFFGMVAFAVSTVAGGGGAMILVPLVNFFVSKDAVAPIVHLGNMIGRPTRIAMFWPSIRWDIVRAYLPLALVGAFLGALVFSKLEMQWLQIVIGLFLISTPWQYKWGKKNKSFAMRLQYFGPLGFFICFLSSITGATGAVLNPFYLNFGVLKEELVATKALNSFVVALIQIATYFQFGKMSLPVLYYGLAIGLGAAVGNFIGKRMLQDMANKTFRRLVIGMMVISGLVILLGQIF